MSETDSLWYDFRNAVHSHDFAEAELLLKNTPNLLTLNNGIGETTLHFLAVENDIEGVRWLHSKGADLNTKNLFGTPVIFEVAQLEYKELFLWFVSNEANVQATDKEGLDIFEYLLEFDHEAMANWVRQNVA